MAGNREETGPSFDPSKVERGIATGATDPTPQNPRELARLRIAAGIKLGAMAVFERPPERQAAEQADQLVTQPIAGSGETA